MQFLLSAIWSSLVPLSSGTASSSFHPKRSPVPYEVQTPPLDTNWTYTVGTDPWPEYPRPQLRRDAWQSLNGIWTWEAAASPDAIDNPPGELLNREVLVPSCIESGLSGIQELDVMDMWFSRYFKVPESWSGKTVLLNFEAVDYEATVFVNGVKVGSHVGGYFRFSINVTEQVKLGQDNYL